MGKQIIINATHSLLNATFLPIVMEQAGWNQLQTLDHLVEKAGHKGKYVDIKDNLT